MNSTGEKSGRTRHCQWQSVSQLSAKVAVAIAKGSSEVRMLLNIAKSILYGGGA